MERGIDMAATMVREIRLGDFEQESERFGGGGSFEEHVKRLSSCPKRARLRLGLIARSTISISKGHVKPLRVK